MCGDDKKRSMSEQIFQEEAVLVSPAPIPTEVICGQVLRLMGDSLQMAEHGRCLKAIGDELDRVYTLAHLLAAYQRQEQYLHSEGNVG